MGKRVALTRAGFRHPLNVDEEHADIYRAQGYVDVDGVSDGPAGYDAMTVSALKDEIEDRNRGRWQDTEIPMDGKKADLIAALEADDESEV